MQNQARIPLIVVLLSCSGMTPAHAQTALPLPPIRTMVDERGVNLLSGKLALTDPLLSIGTPDNGLSFVRYWFNSVGWSHNYIISARGYSPGDYVEVSVGGRLHTFTKVGGVFKSDQDDGSNLTEEPSIYIFTDRDGTKITLDRSLGSSTSTFYHSIITAAATSIEPPSGPRINLYYKKEYVNGFLPYLRLQSVRSATGFQLKFYYATNVLNGSTIPDWRRMTSVRAINAVNEFCDPTDDPTALTCPGSGPSVTFTRTVDPTNSNRIIEEVTDPENRVRRFLSAGDYLLGVRRPSSPATNSVSYDYITKNGWVYIKSATVDGVGTWLYDYTLTGSTGTETVTTPTITTPRVIVSNTTLQQPTSIKDENGRETLFEYFPSGLLKKVTQPEGNSVTYGYDPRGNLTSTVATPKSGSGDQPLTTSAQFPDSCTNLATCNKPEWTKDTAGNVTNYHYNPDGTLDYVQAPQPDATSPRPETHFTYATLQGVFKVSSSSVAGGENVVMPTGTITCITGSWPCQPADQRVTVVAYDTNVAGNNLMVSSTTIKRGSNSESSTTTYGYDQRGNLQSTTDQFGQTTYQTYGADRQVKSVRFPAKDGSSTGQRRALDFHYDVNGQVDVQSIGQINADGTGYVPWQRTTSAYDSAGRPVAQSVADGSGGTTFSRKQMSYDGAGRPECVTIRMNTADFASPLAACIQGTGGKDRITRYVWEPAGALDRVQTGYGVANEQRDFVRYTRTQNGQISSMIDAKANVTSYAYDGHDRLLRECYNHTVAECASDPADNSFIKMTYDSVGRLTARKLRGYAPGVNIGFSYDNLGRIKSVDYPGSGTYDSDVSYTYDNLGQMLRADDAAGHSATYGYDALGNITKQGDAISDSTMKYDSNGRRIEMKWSDGEYVTYDYWATGEMKTIKESGSTPLATFDYDIIGRRTSLTRGNGVTTYYDYDGASRLACLRQDLSGGGAPTCSATSVAATENDQATNFTYNAANQIAGRTAANDLYVFLERKNGSIDYSSNALNQYTASGVNQPTYDVKGNLESVGGGIIWGYSTKNELVARDDLNSGMRTGFYHNPSGRIDTVTSGAISGLLVPQYGLQYVDGKISAEIGGTSPYTIKRRYVYGPNPDEAILWYEGAGLTDKKYLVADERGSIVAVTDATGGATAINTYDELGIPGALNKGRIQFTGQAWFAELDMYSYKARVYSPMFGRFLQTDPIGSIDGPNVYNYASSDPINLTDPSGTTAAANILIIGPSVVSSFDVGLAASQWRESSEGSGQAIIITGRRIGLSVVGRTIVYQAGIGDYIRGRHDYISGPNLICAASWGCDKFLVGQIYSQVRNSVPGNTDSRLLVSGRDYNVFVAGTFLGRVTSYVGKDRLTVTNVTLPGHILYDGWIQRNAYIDAMGNWVSETHGKGVNYYFGIFNSLANQFGGPLQFDSMDASVRDQLYNATH